MSEFKGKDFGTVLTEKDIENAIENGEVKHLIQHIENVVIQKALIKTKGNQRAAAELIGMSRNKLGERVRQLAKYKSLNAEW